MNSKLGEGLRKFLQADSSKWIEQYQASGEMNASHCIDSSRIMAGVSDRTRATSQVIGSTKSVRRT